MLPKFYRFRVLWEADQTLTYANAARVEIDVQPWEIDSSNALVYGTVITSNFGFTSGTIVDDGEVESAVIDNTSNLHFGFDGTLKVIADVSGTDGTMTLFMERSDLDANWPSDLADFDIQDLVVLCVLPMSTDAVDEGRAKNFKYPG